VGCRVRFGHHVRHALDSRCVVDAAGRRPGPHRHLSAHSIRRQNPRIVAYTASKAALSSVTKNLSKKPGQGRHSAELRLPGHHRHRQLHREPQRHSGCRRPGCDQSGRRDDLVDNNFHQPCDLGRAGLPEEIASITTYLASRRNGYVTGATVNVNGDGDGGSDFV